MAGKKGCGGKKGRSGRKSKRFEFEIARLKELSLKRAIKTLEEKNAEESRKDQIMLKVIDKTLAQEVNLTSDPENPVKFEFYLPKNNGHLNNGNGNGHSVETASGPSRIIP